MTIFSKSNKFNDKSQKLEKESWIAARHINREPPSLNAWYNSDDKSSKWTADKKEKENM